MDDKLVIVYALENQDKYTEILSKYKNIKYTIVDKKEECSDIEVFPTIRFFDKGELFQEIRGCNPDNITVTLEILATGIDELRTQTTDGSDEEGEPEESKTIEESFCKLDVEEKDYHDDSSESNSEHDEDEYGESMSSDEEL